MNSLDPDRPFPAALPAPEGDQVPIDLDLLERALRLSRESPRGRIIQRLHVEDGDPLQRMLNVIQPGSYVRPHRHTEPPKAETIVILRGAIGYVAFTASGKVARSIRVGVGGGLDIRPGVLHTFFALEPDTVVFECKAGPYAAVSDKDFADWAPAEGDPETATYLARLETLFT